MGEIRDMLKSMGKALVDELAEEKKKKIKTKKVVKKKADRKSPGHPSIRAKASGGQVRNRNIGGVIGGGLNSQDVVDYLYKYKS